MSFLYYSVPPGMLKSFRVSGLSLELKKRTHLLTCALPNSSSSFSPAPSKCMKLMACPKQACFHYFVEVDWLGKSTMLGVRRLGLQDTFKPFYLKVQELQKLYPCVPVLPQSVPERSDQQIELPVLSFKYRPSLVLTGSAQAHLDTIKVWFLTITNRSNAREKQRAKS